MKVFHQDRARKKRMAVGVLAASMLASVLGLAPSANALSAVWEVDDCSVADFIDGVEAANLSGDLDTIVLEDDCEYEFNHGYLGGDSALPEITDDLTIYGRGAEVSSDADDDVDPYSSFRFLSELTGNSVVIRDLKIEDFEVFTQGAGGDFGGCLLTTGPLTLRNVKLDDCEVFAVDPVANIVLGGAVASLGPLTVRSSTVSGSSATAVADIIVAGVFGGGIYGDDTVDIASSTVKGNTATGTGTFGSTVAAGGLAATDTLTMASTTVSKNSSVSRASSFGIAGNFSLGGGIVVGVPSTAPNTIRTSTVDGNKAKAEGGFPGLDMAVGGGILNASPGTGTEWGLEVDTTGQTKITNNKATCDEIGCDALGGGYANANVVGGTIGTALFNNTLFKGNVADGDDGTGLGGGLYLAGDGTGGPTTGEETVLNNATITKNTAKGDTFEAGGGIYAENAAGVDIDESTITKNKPDNCFSAVGTLVCGL